MIHNNFQNLKVVSCPLSIRIKILMNNTVIEKLICIVQSSNDAKKLSLNMRMYEIYFQKMGCIFTFRYFPERITKSK